MAATGKTPILLYGSTTASNVPTAGNLTNSSDGCEIAINVADKNLFFKDSTNAVNTVPIRQSSASSNGWLSSTDWSTFNGKAPAFTYTTNYIPFGQGTTTPTQSANLQFDGTALDVTGYFRSSGGAYAPNQAVTALISKVGGVWSNKIIGGSDSVGVPYLSLQVASDASNNSTEIMKLSATGNNAIVTSGNLVIGTSGKGIDFSATAGTGTSELLADYEEGTWTPDQGAGLIVVGTFSSSGTYTKIGNLVTVTALQSGSTSISAGSSNILFTNLPFTVNSSASRFSGTCVQQISNSGGVSAIGGSTNVYSATYFAPSSATLVTTITYQV